MVEVSIPESLDQKFRQIRDRARGVAHGFITGFYLWGPGGTSKTYTVEETLKEVGKPYKLTNSRLTGKGLFDLLDAYPAHIHVLDDVETLFSDKNAHGVLRAALWGQERRLVTWQTDRGRQEVVFEGGIILVANSPLEEVPALRALATRIVTLKYAPTTEELAGLMRRMASAGFRHGRHQLGTRACAEVAEEVISRSVSLGRGLDLRLYVNGCLDRVQFEAGAAETHWVDLLESRIQQRAVAPRLPSVPLSEEARCPAGPACGGKGKLSSDKESDDLYRLLLRNRGTDAVGEN